MLSTNPCAFRSHQQSRRLSGLAARPQKACLRLKADITRLGTGIFGQNMAQPCFVEGRGRCGEVVVFDVSHNLYYLIWYCSLNVQNRVQPITRREIQDYIP
jgi:hypothetical protein